jgi:DNA-binding CsgD family transcriptional regulator
MKTRTQKPPAPEASPRLTRREKQTLELLLRGLSDKLIAAQLELSVGGVRRHCQSLHRKFGVNSRMEIAAKFLAGDRSMFAT